MTRHFKLLAAVGITSVLFGCATARVVTVAPGEGGEIAISSATNAEARQKAEMIMLQNCNPKSYKITKEGEAEIGTYTQSNARGQQFANGASAAQANSYTRKQMEWRLTYICQTRKDS